MLRFNRMQYGINAVLISSKPKKKEAKKVPSKKSKSTRPKIDSG